MLRPYAIPWLSAVEGAIQLFEWHELCSDGNRRKPYLLHHLCRAFLFQTSFWHRRIWTNTHTIRTCKHSHSAMIPNTIFNARFIWKLPLMSRTAMNWCWSRGGKHRCTIAGILSITAATVNHIYTGFVQSTLWAKSVIPPMERNNPCACGWSGFLHSDPHLPEIVLHPVHRRKSQILLYKETHFTLIKPSHFFCSVLQLEADCLPVAAIDLSAPTHLC